LTEAKQDRERAFADLFEARIAPRAATSNATKSPATRGPFTSAPSRSHALSPICCVLGGTLGVAYG